MAKRTQGGRRWGLCLVLALFMLLTAGVASAAGDPEGLKIVDPVNHFDNCSAVLYDNTNGLPTSEANAIVQTSEGFIWIGSYAGLIRYDGNTFVRMDSTGGLTSIKCLYVDGQDRLWIGTNDNGIAVMERGELKKWGKLDGLKSAHTRAITGDQNGNMNLVMPTGKNVKDFNGSLVLNDTGAFIFEKLQKGSTPEQTAGALTQEYDVPLDTASADVKNTVASMIEAGVAEA